MSDEERQAVTEPRPPSPSIERFLPGAAIAAMIGAYVTLTPYLAMTLIGAIWLAGTRLSRSRRMLGLSLTEALAWAATILIVESLAVIVLVLLAGLTNT